LPRNQPGPVESFGGRDEAKNGVTFVTHMQQSELDELMGLHDVWLEMGGSHGKQLWLEYADLSGLDLSGRDLVDCFLPRANLDGANLADANIAAAHLYGASLRYTDLRRANLAKANLGEVQANHAQLVEANLLRCQFSNADLRGASLDQATLIKTFLRNADLRGCTMRFAKLEDVRLPGAVFGPIDATGATGSFMSADVFWETDGQRQVLNAEQFIAALQAAGAEEITAIAPSI
jgi:uncharacterized protein YjbI with pentapeptide repeats